MIPESKAFLIKLYGIIQRKLFIHRTDKLFLMVVDQAGDIKSAWVDETPYATVNFDDQTYDVENVKHWFGWRTMLVLKNSRHAPDFSKYDENFVNVSSLARYSKEANVKMNNRNAYELTRGLTDGNLHAYATYAAVGLGLICVAYLSDTMHIPSIEIVQSQLTQVINITSNIRR